MKTLILLVFFLLPSLTAYSAPSVLFAQAKKLSDAKDYLGFRIYMKGAYSKKMNHAEWFALKNLIAQVADHSGYDLIPFWNARNLKAYSELDNQLNRADELMKQGQYEAAFLLTQQSAQKMKVLEKTRRDAKVQLPYLYHSMGRALYGAHRYDEAVKVYQWISPQYPYFTQVLFEKMWAAFKSGRVDLALGAVASQRSSYFASYLPPESYLIQSYLYRRLCRDEDQKQVVDELKRFEAVLSKADSALPLVSDISTLVLSRLSDTVPSPSDDSSLVSESSREKEKTLLKNSLKKMVESKRAKTLKNIQMIIAYQQLGGQSDTKQVLKPVEKMKSRDDLLKQNLEVWPADSEEEWMDELGKHVLLGESLCKQQK